MGNLNESLRKFLKDAYIVDVNLNNDDRIVEFVIQKANDYYEKVVTHLYLECIPQRANLLFVNEEGIYPIEIKKVGKRINKDTLSCL